MIDLLTFGETMALLTAPRIGRLRDMPSLELTAAGAESNVAIGMARLGRSVSWVGRVGTDELGELILGCLRREGVDVSGAIRDPDVPTAIMLKERRTTEVVRVTYYRSGYAGSRLCPADLSYSQLSDSRIIHLTGITLGLSDTARAASYAFAEAARAAGVLVSFDFNYRRALWSPSDAATEFRRMATMSDLVFANVDELDMLEPGIDVLALARELSEKGRREVVVKQGSMGAMTVVGDRIDKQEAISVTSVDPVGAGDAFVAGYLDAVLDNKDVTERLRRGCVCGAFAVTVVGDWEGAPTTSDLDLLAYGSGTTIR